ncbi:hypothetical protein FRB99_007987 [Tulasnella sp. 403]|nr:hypothetical protein FRB99_007987 [Tulasnella sp. 403]
MVSGEPILNDDPFSLILAPPPNESLLERDRRLRLEADAKRISDIIDEQIRKEAIRRKKNVEVKLLLLGQSSSGKSTLQKQFQLMYAPASLDLERSSWVPVVYINIIKTVRIMLETLEYEFDLEIDREYQMFTPSVASSSKFPAYDLDEPTTPSSTKGKGKQREDDDSDPSRSGPKSPSTLPSSWAQQLATLRLRLIPLLSMEESLARKIGTGVQVAPGREEVFVRTGWQGIRRKPAAEAIDRSPAPTSVFQDTPAQYEYGSRLSMGSAESVSTNSDDMQLDMDQRAEIIRQVANLLVLSHEDVTALYNHPAVKLLVKKRKLRLEESSIHFLANLQRIAVAEYSPSDDDILRARLRTMGVVEHYFEIPSSNKVYGWRLYDVGGARGQRPSWVPYFEDATAIIFLAPISAFDQYLEEDQRTNRVDDSLQLFTLICSSPLLKNCHLVLFLNKTDVLRRKLEMGIKVKKYITSYGDRPNDYDHVSNYFVAHFKQVHRKNNVDAKRELYTHLTSVVDTRSTRQIITNVRDAILRDYLKESSML